MNDIPDLLDALRRTPAILSAFVRTIPGDKLDLRRGETFWTLAEHISHLARVQPMLLKRFEQFMNEEHPVFVPYIPGGVPEAPPPMSVPDALAQFAQYRDRQLRLLEGAGSATWKRTGTHPEYEAYSLYILTRHALMHDYWHMYRMEELWLAKDAFLTALE